MNRNDPKYQAYVKILEEELVTALGCTEPIAIAYAAAKAKETLGTLPDEMIIEVSANIIKNVKSVVVPNTNGLRGIPAAAAVGAIAGNAAKELEVIVEVTELQKKQTQDFLKNTSIEVRLTAEPHIVFIKIHMKKGKDYSIVKIANRHNNIFHVEKNGEVLFEKEVEVQKDDQTDRSLLTVKDIVDFVDTVDLEDVRDVIQRQIDFNTKIAEEGMRGIYGANIGKVILSKDFRSVVAQAKAMAAAGSDARMNGCELPVVIVSGSGNQGMTASLPVIAYGRRLGVSWDKRFRAVILSDLVTIHQKTGIGRLSAYCGAVSAGCGSGAGIAYLHGGDYNAIAHTIINTLAIASGMVCDGAKASCAAKIAVAVEAGILGYYMYQDGQGFEAGDGLVTGDVEENIRNIGRLAREGMSRTDQEILRMMVGDEYVR